jgi:hypothetical protein
MASLSLSEKVKGKQRAMEPLDTTLGAGSSSQSPPTPDDTEHLSQNLVVRFTDGLPDLTVTIEKEDTAQDVKRKVRVFLFSLSILSDERRD